MGEVLNAYVQAKFSLAATGEAHVAQLAANAERNPNRALAGLKALVFYAPRADALDALLALMKHDKAKAERLCHMLLLALGARCDVAGAFGAVSSALHRGVTASDVSRRALALRSYGALLPRGQTFGDMFADLAAPLVRAARDAQQRAAAELRAKKLSAKAAAALCWEQQIVQTYVLLALRLAPPAAPDAFFADARRAETVQLIVGALQAAEPVTARHAAAVALLLARRRPADAAAALRGFALPPKAPEALQAPGLVRDALAGTYFVRAAALLARSPDVPQPLAEEFHCYAVRTVLSDNAKLFCEAAAALAPAWERLATAAIDVTVPQAPGQTPQTQVEPILHVIVRRVATLCHQDMRSMPAKHAAVRLVANLSREYARHASSSAKLAPAGTTTTTTTPSPLAGCTDTLVRIAASSEEPAALRGAALIALCWLAQTPADLSALSPLVNSMLATSRVFFAETWRSFVARVQQSPALAGALLELCAQALLAAPPLAAPLPMDDFHAAWLAVAAIDRTAAMRHLLQLLKTPYAPENRVALLEAKRDICSFVAENAEVLLGSTPTAAAATSVLAAIEIHATTGSHILRRRAIEALGQLAVRVPAARHRVTDFLQAMRDEPSTADLCDAIIQLLGTVEKHAKAPNAAAVRAQLQLLWDPATFAICS